MRHSKLRALKARFLVGLRYLWRKKGVWLRGSLCLAIGLCFLFLDENRKFDSRFQVRGPQEASKEIVVVHLNQSDWTNYHGANYNPLRPIKEITAVTDSFFWNQNTWSKLLSKILKDDPSSVGVTLYFGKSNLKFFRNIPQKSSLRDPRVIWSAILDNDGRIHKSSLARGKIRNSGLNQILSDNDGIVRRFNSKRGQIPHLSYRLASKKGFEGDDLKSKWMKKGFLKEMNFRGKPFSSISFKEVIEGHFNKKFFRDKIVIIGLEKVDMHEYRTPLGKMTRSEVIATMTDNMIHNRWIKPLSFLPTLILLLGLLVLSILIMFNYPQMVAFIFLFWLGTTLVSFSLWIFDSYYYWIPIQAPIIQLATTYIVFLSYQLTVNENLNWRLEQEKIYLTEVEQLKNNFVSLFSHDLKTPIAKIQAICDRLLSHSLEDPTKEGIHSVRKESVELHRYIQTILQVSKLESRDFKIRKEATDINEIIENVAQQLTPLSMAQQAQLELNLEPMFLIEVDTLLVQEVILNLVENAIKYSQNGAKIKISSKEIDDRVVIMVEDNGPGIPASEQKEIFEKFVRGKKHQMSTKGSGLGLYLVKYFIELHGGQIELESQENEGTRVSFTLPIQVATSQDEVSEVTL